MTTDPCYLTFMNVDIHIGCIYFLSRQFLLSRLSRQLRQFRQSEKRTMSCVWKVWIFKIKVSLFQYIMWIKRHLFQIKHTFNKIKQTLKSKTLRHVTEIRLLRQLSVIWHFFWKIWIIWLNYQKEMRFVWKVWEVLKFCKSLNKKKCAH